MSFSKIYFFLAFYSLAATVFTQTIFPDPVIWLNTYYSSATEAVLTNLADTLTSWESLDQQSINFHTVPELNINLLSENVSISIEHPNLTIFSIYQDKINDREQVIWSINKQSIPHIYASNNRFNNLTDSIEYIFNGIDNQYLRLSTHFINTSKRQSDQYFFKVGELANANQLSFNGILPEVLVFDRILSKHQRKQVETYLAVKYGIPLLSIAKIEYINSNGDAFWSARAKEQFKYNITGLGRDDFWNLHQKQATSSYEPNLITIGTDSIQASNIQNEGQINNLSYLIWADNNQYLGQSKKENDGSNELLDRRWQVTSIQFSELKTELKLGMRQLKNELEESEQYWLAIDRSGTNTFPVATTDYYAPQKNRSKREYAYYTGILWDQDSSGKDVFTFLAGQDMILAHESVLPDCTTGILGSISMKIHGGTPPYKYILTNINNTPPFSETWDGELLVLNELLAGNYQIHISDAEGRVYLDNIDLHYSDLIEEQFLSSEYQLLNNKSLDLTFPSSCSSCAYTWILTNGQKSFDPTISITETGRYGLQIEKSNCIDTHFFGVTKPPRTPFQSVELWGNPSQNGHYVLEVRLWESLPIIISVYDQNGRLVHQEVPAMNHYYKYTGNNLAPGTYNIKVNCQGQFTTKSLIMF